jgi:hypothetical protein
LQVLFSIRSERQLVQHIKFGDARKARLLAKFADAVIEAFNHAVRLGMAWRNKAMVDLGAGAVDGDEEIAPGDDQQVIQRLFRQPPQFDDNRLLRGGTHCVQICVQSSPSSRFCHLMIVALLTL